MSRLSNAVVMTAKRALTFAAAAGCVAAPPSARTGKRWTHGSPRCGCACWCASSSPWWGGACAPSMAIWFESSGFSHCKQPPTQAAGRLARVRDGHDAPVAQAVQLWAGSARAEVSLKHCHARLLWGAQRGSMLVEGSAAVCAATDLRSGPDRMSRTRSRYTVNLAIQRQQPSQTAAGPVVPASVRVWRSHDESICGMMAPESRTRPWAWPDPYPNPAGLNLRITAGMAASRGSC